jgi:hypothetical protein
MTIAALLTAIGRLPVFHAPASKPLSSHLEAIAVNDGFVKALPCHHELQEGASPVELAQLRTDLDIQPPDSLLALLRVSNGARLFCLTYDVGALGTYTIPRYDVLGTEQLSVVNRSLRETYASYLTDDLDALIELPHLDYIAFCNIGDGNFLAIVTGGQERGTIFLLDHDYGYFPFSEVTNTPYEIVASGLEEWLSMVLTSHGCLGAGMQFIPL